MERKKRVLVFFPDNPYTLGAGYLRRCQQMLIGFKDIGCEVTLSGSTFRSHYQWDESSINGIRDKWGMNVILFRPDRLWLKLLPITRRLIRLIGKNFTAEDLIKIRITHWFNDVIRNLSPDIVLVNYSTYDFLLRDQKGRSFITAIDHHDLLSLNRRMYSELKKLFFDNLNMDDGIDGQVLQENYFEKFEFVSDPEEFKIYDKFDFTISISNKEADIIKENTKKTKVLWIPMTFDPVFVKNSYNGNAVFAGGPNYFNTQGYYYFIKRVLPLIRKKIPEFILQVTNEFPLPFPFPPEKNVIISGFIPDLGPVYERARFSVCPLIAGTGQKVKIIEAMAHGLSVVATRQTQEGSPLEHEVNGLIADNVFEFAEYVIRLWDDQKLCKKFGEAAREKITVEFSHKRLLKELSQAFLKEPYV